MQRPPLFWLQIAISTGLVAGFLLSPRLWLSSRLYPLTPVSALLHPIPWPFDLLVLLALLLLLAWAAIATRPAKALAAFLVLAALYALYDQSRWQRWFYQYWFMLAAVCLSYLKPEACGRKESAWILCQVIVASVHFWSGIHKVNAVFVHDTFPWMIEPFAGILPGGITHGVEAMAILGPIVEAAIGICLVTGVLRRSAVVAAVGMHAFISGEHWSPRP